MEINNKLNKTESKNLINQNKQIINQVYWVNKNNIQ